ncbi:MAG: hypothetical protein Q7T39_22365 [Polaromonas sp.]|nr:hypothetical protein [Polaromonas sp.]
MSNTYKTIKVNNQIVDEAKAIGLTPNEYIMKIYYEQDINSKELTNEVQQLKLQLQRVENRLPDEGLLDFLREMNRRVKEA